ncbi:translocation/assembly module TamB domain-containing protein [Nitrosospira sp. NRS527]|uniref:translocation/assembly module TamB domain-containing protein n=1 Tax=Nitrosospira sp. NRS527 TaxID=155925 RepID=UPI001BD10676|nr:translocation/assembly module TamB domain-containing protein [Nitrosospira sp. NRS527]
MKKWRWQWAALVLVALITLAAGIGIWLSTSTSGLKSLASVVSHISGGNLSFEELDGALSGSIRARTIRFVSDDLLVIARDVQLNWQPSELRSGHVTITALSAKEVEIVSLPSSQPKSLPASLELPFSLSLHKLDIGTLRVMNEEGGRPVFVAAELTAGLESNGRRHRLSGLRTNLEFGRLIGSGQLDGIRPFDLHAEAELAELANSDFPALQTTGSRISAIIKGNLERLDMTAKGSGAGLTGQGEAQLQPYGPVFIAGLSLSVSGLDPHVFSAGAPTASLTVQANLHEVVAGQLEGSVSVENSAPKTLDQGGLPMLQARAQPIVSAELLQFNDLMLVASGGGTVSGSLAWQLEEATGSADLIISRVDPAKLDTRLRPASLNGKVKLSGDTQNQNAFLSLRDKASRLDAHMVRAGDALTLDKMSLSHGRSQLTGEGKLGLSGPRAFNFEGKLQNFDVSAFAQAPQTSLNATLALAGELEPGAAGGTASGPAGAIHFKMGNSHVAKQPVSGHGRVEIAGFGRARGEVEARLGSNHVTARGGFGRKGDQLQFELVAPALVQIGHGLSGSLAARAVLESSSADFSERGFQWPDMTFNAKGNNLALPGEHHFGSVAADGSLHGDVVALTITAADYATKKKTLLQNLTLEVKGKRSRHEVRVAARLNEHQSLVLRAGGELNKPAQQWQNAQWLGELSELSGTGRFSFQLTGVAPLGMSAKHVSFGAAKFIVAGGTAQIDGIEWTPQIWSSRGNFTGIGLRLSTDAVENGPKDNEALRLGGKWDIASGARLTGSLSVARESGDWILPGGDSPLPLGLQTLQLAAQAVDGRLTGEFKARGKRLGEASASISVPVTRSAESAMNWTVLPDATLTGNLLVDMDDISWAGPAFDDNIRTGGRLALRADVVGTFGSPRLDGQIYGDDLALALLEQGVRLEQGKLSASFDQESLHMDVLNFTAPHVPPPNDRLLKNVKLAKGPGSLSASGVMDLKGQRGNLEIIADLVPLAQRPDRWIIASGNGRASLENNMLTLKGSLAANAGLIAQPTAGSPHLPDDITVTGGASSDHQPDRKGLRVDMEANLDLGDQFYIRASGLEGRLAGQLSLRGEPGHRLRAIGTIAARDTSFEAYGQRLAVERGIVDFKGPIDDPALNVLAVRKGLAVEAGVEVTGSVRQPKVRLVSTPLVPDLEKLSWIALGRSPGGKADASLLLAAAASILGGQSGGITDKISQAIGVDELTIKQAGSDALMGQVGIVGKRLSKRAYISYEQGLTAVVGVTKLTYTLTPRINLVTRAGIDNAIDVLYTLRFD